MSVNTGTFLHARPIVRHSARECTGGHSPINPATAVLLYCMKLLTSLILIGVLLTL